MNLWLQTRLFTCLKCGAKYVHDKSYFHACFKCPKRAQAQAKAGRLAKP
jgi:hypothetical protein